VIQIVEPNRCRKHIGVGACFDLRLGPASKGSDNIQDRAFASTTY
jgi:hypothetical protein